MNTMTSILKFLVLKYQVCPIFLLKLCGTTMPSYLAILSYKYFNKMLRESKTRWKSPWKFPVLETFPLLNQSPVEALVGEWLRKLGGEGRRNAMLRRLRETARMPETEC